MFDRDPIPGAIRAAVSFVGGIAAPVRNPLKKAIVGLAGRVAPQSTERVVLWLASIKSNHASAETPLMDIFDAVLIPVLYLAAVKVGNRLMRDRKPFSMKTFGMLHNLFSMALSLYLSVAIFYEAFWVHRHSLIGGNAVDESPSGARLAELFWVFYFSKLPEFNDTLIMVLKKSTRQITFLHTYHHASMILICWMGCWVAPGGDCLFNCLVNSFVHVIMYGYYFFSMVGVKQVSFIRPYITRLQIAQFSSILVREMCTLLSYALGRPTGFPIGIVVAETAYNLSMLALFLTFYRAAYTSKLSTGTKKDE
ncbi:long chain polyunsaturated fatty acid elongation enzyme [Gonapodya prolifera JEL478]|uniref:Elongation of fatty acids protein n=1 Tax=Gonapodya prolifera (strain JEL478) TaxID=1344416 RepID=A0A139AMU6_GONPJ|nr:long chain polyunsaturated fatty acid elongation enzyme [Gonapodya prolifera JEL478]|eukprot:KXS18081.1 long chain polyunsaturated fatty acid elongation enzyme [Gonapodya prolifera JEL478]